MSGSEQAFSDEWFVAVDGVPRGPISVSRLSEMIFARQVTPEDLVWCRGMPGWLPLSQALGAVEQEKPRPHVIVVEVEAAERRGLAEQVASLSQLYVDKLRDLGLPAPLWSASIPRPWGVAARPSSDEGRQRHTAAFETDMPSSSRTQGSGTLVEVEETSSQASRGPHNSYPALAAPV